MLSSRARLAFAVALAALVAACSSGGAVAPTTTPAEATTSTTAVPATTAAPTTTTLPPVTTTTTSIPGQVGDPQALRVFIDQIRSNAVDLGETQFEGVEIPYPDLTNPDPSIALGEAFAFEAWLMDIGAYTGFLEVLTYPDSPRQRDIGSDFVYWDSQNLRFDGVERTYEVLTAAGASLDSADMGENALAALPPSSVAIAFSDKGGPYRLVASTGDEADLIEAFESNGVAVLTPTSLGWRLYWVGEPSP